MLTGRSIVIAAIAFAVLSLLGTIVLLLQPPDQGGLGADTYGTRAHGYKALYDTLRTLGFDERRALAPPNESAAKATTLVLWGAQNDLVQIEPVYLGRLRQWVRNGGRIVIAPQATRDYARELIRRPPSLNSLRPTSALREIGLPAIETDVVDVSTMGATNLSSSAAVRSRANDNSNRRSLTAQFESYLFPELFPTTMVRVKAEGGLAALTGGVAQLEVPTEVQALDLGLMKPDGKITVVGGRRASTGEQSPPVLAAQFRLGAGEVIVVGDPAIFDNRLLSQADNAVLAVHLLGEPQQTIVWDEFYHGLTIRGNPLYLLTRGEYALVAVLVVAFTAVWVWRKSVFLGPPLAAATVARRSLGEYVDAMANFLHRGSRSLSFMLSELRRGVLWSLRRQFGSYRDHETPEEVAAAVARRDPRRARQLLDAVGSADQMLSHQSRVKHREYLQVTKDLIDCL